MVQNVFKPKVLKHDDPITTLNVMPVSSYSLDINLEKLMYCAIAVIHKYEQDKAIEASSDNEIQISDQAFYKLLYGDENSDLSTKELIKQKHNNLQKVRRIMQRAYSNFDASPIMEVYQKDNDTPSKVPMILKLHYNSSTKVLTMQLAKEFYNYFYNMGNKSFSYHTLRQIMSLDSYVSLRLYRIFNSVKWRADKIILTYDEIRKILKKEGKYGKHSHMKMIIDEAVKEINSNTNFNIDHTYLKQGSSSYNSIEFIIQNKATNVISRKFKNSLELLRDSYLKNDIPWSDDLSHFKNPNRYKYFEAPKKLSIKQVKFLLTSDAFLNDYSFAYSGLGSSVTKELAQSILKPLLQNELALLNSHKKIDYDYYIALSYEKKESDIDDQEVE
ncbi:replication initiation protein [Acinetobacter sp. ANC 5380]|uniref:Replication initiation protein n=1 Tax=Acinetobacter terrae TaxID=2731247 RepID=A0A7Y2WAF5_9GAMM|nr:replication initiation protein [Acinetobacter terrae]NNH77391.1 replication initiation protein [Acinetobacter terrae]